MACQGISWREEENTSISDQANDLGERLQEFAENAHYDSDDPQEVLMLTEELSNLLQWMINRALRDPRLSPIRVMK